MALQKFLDYAGTNQLWTAIKAKFDAQNTINGNVDTALTNAENDIDALEALHAAGVGGGKKTVAQEINDALTNADFSNVYAGKSYEGKVDTLIGTDTEKSVRTIANEELAAQLIPANAAEALDTLQEIAAWIQAHPGDVSTMNAEIAALENYLTTAKKSDIDAAIAAKHTHANSAALANLTQTVIDNSHTHTNQTQLDAIDAAAVTAIGKIGSGTLAAGDSTNLIAAVNALFARDTYTPITTAELTEMITPSGT